MLFSMAAVERARARRYFIRTLKIARARVNPISISAWCAIKAIYLEAEPDTGSEDPLALVICILAHFGEEVQSGASCIRSAGIHTHTHRHSQTHTHTADTVVIMNSVLAASLQRALRTIVPRLCSSNVSLKVLTLIPRAISSA